MITDLGSDRWWKWR